jgi:GT2 family glycosyltransferase
MESGTLDNEFMESPAIKKELRLRKTQDHTMHSLNKQQCYPSTMTQPVKMDVSVIVVSYNTIHLLPEMMSKMQQASAGLAVETIIIDNASSDESVRLIREKYADCQLIVNAKNVGFGRANNQALPFIKGQYVLLLNTDAFVAPDTLTKTIAYMDAHENCGILGVRLVGRDDEAQASARFFPSPWRIFLKRTNLIKFLPGARVTEVFEDGDVEPKHCDWVPGCYYLIRKAVIDQVGLFDPRYFLYCEELDHCFAAKKAGWDVVCYPDTTVVHIGGESAKFDGTITKNGRQLEALGIESELLYFRKNHGTLAVFIDLALHSLADAIVTIKQLAKRSQPGAISTGWLHNKLMWSLFFRTRCGTRPTR